MTKRGPLRQRFSRRSLLRGLGAGTAMLAPCVRERASQAQAAPPGNLLIFYTPNGHRRNLVINGQSMLGFDASAAGGLTLGRSLAPLQPFRSDVAVIKGLNLKTSTFIASHQDICRILTCWGAPTEGSDSSQFTGFGPSIDQSIASAFNQRPLIVAVDPYREAPHWRTVLSWSASGVSEPFVKDHQAALIDLFSSGVTGMGPTAGQVATLARARAQARSAVVLGLPKLDGATPRHPAHSVPNALRSVGQRGAVLGPACAPSTFQARIAALPATAATQVDDKSRDGVAAEMQARGELWMDMIAASFACGSRRVAVIQWQGASEGYDPAANIGSPTHHSVTQNSAGAATDERWAAIDTWYANRFAYQLAALKKLGILDRTIVAWVSEITEGHHQLNMVTVVAGGQALGMKMGQYIQYPFTGTEVEGTTSIPIAQNPANRSLSDLWVTIQQAMGVDKSTFGDPKWCTGPLTELRG